MSRGPWKKYKKKKIKGVNGKKGYVFEKEVYKDANGQSHIFLPKRFANKEVTLILIEKEEGAKKVDYKNKDAETIDPFK